MTKIVTIQTKLLKSHLVDIDFKATYGVESTVRNHVIVKIRSDDGTSGIGEAFLLPDLTGETHETIKLMIDKYYSPLLINKSPFDLESIHKEMDHKYPANTTTKAAIDMALYDLIGKTLNIPAYKLLGGIYHKYVELGAVLGINKPSIIARKAENCVNQGAKAIKLKVGLTAKQDITTIKAVREILNDIRIRIDANAGYSLKTAMKVLKKIEKYDVEYAEQPIASWNHKGLKLLRNYTNIPICVDESLLTIEDAMNLIRNEVTDFFGIKLIKHGGIYKAKKIAILAEANGIKCVLISPWETHIGQAAGLHLAISSPNFDCAHELSTKELKDDPTFGLQEDNGIIRISKSSGLGITYDFEGD
ncbi:MAG: mandelate racemase/muconate lactonizing enzyme family protein [Promethearchaeota archaeon]